MGWNPFADLAKGGIEGLGSAVKEAVGAFKADPTKVAELESALNIAVVNAQAAMITAVNQSMQAEAKSEHWLQYSWRPLYGYTGILLILHNYVLASYFARFGLTPLVVPSEIWYLLTAVVGVSAYTRGQAQIEQVKKNGS
jgi:Holin of 3TMs, for gene-transfer release